MIHNQNLTKIQQTSFETSTKKTQLFELEFLQIFTTASLLKKTTFLQLLQSALLKNDRQKTEENH